MFSYYNTRYLTSLISGTLLRLLHVNLKGLLAGLAVSMLREGALNFPLATDKGRLLCHAMAFTSFNVVLGFYR